MSLFYAHPNFRYITRKLRKTSPSSICKISYPLLCPCICFMHSELPNLRRRRIAGGVRRDDTWRDRASGCMVDDAETADSLSPGVAGTKRPIMISPSVDAIHSMPRRTFATRTSAPTRTSCSGEDSSTPSARHQATTVPLVAVAGVVVRIRRLPQVAAMQPPGERVARGAARDQDPAERRPGGGRVVGEKRRRCRRAPAAVARPMR